MITRCLLRYFYKNKQFFENLLFSKQKCNAYCEFKINVSSYADQIFLIELFRYYQKKNFYKKYGFVEKFIDFIFCLNAKFRFPTLRLFFDLLVIYLQTISVSLSLLFSSRTLLVESGLSDKFSGVLIYPSFTSYFLNIRFLFCGPNHNINFGIKPITFVVTRNIFMSFQFSGFLLLLPTLLFEMCLYIRYKLGKNNIICFKCRGTMCIINRFYATILKANGCLVHLNDHGVPRDCVAEYAIFTEASGYADCIPPIKEKF